MFEIPGWDEFVDRCEGVVDKWEDKKKLLLKKMANICLEEISPLIPVDTSNLVSKFQVGVVTPDYAEVGTNVEYALYVNDGHAQHRRFLPVSYLSVKGKKKYIDSSENIGGIMLKERYIPGAFFLEKGMQAATPRMKRLGESFMVQIGREIEGSKM